MKLDGKLEPADYEFELIGEEIVNGVTTLKLAGTPLSSEIAEELGYSYLEAWVDRSNWMILKAHFQDLKGKPLKTLEVIEVGKIDDFWTRLHVVMHNHQTGHQTRFLFSDVDYSTPVEDDWFSKSALERGI